tara:strand:+ start:335 stop:652 length:318 start_codon:yes stop_codon:yes gene_type:complete
MIQNKIEFDRDEVYNHYIQNFSDELNNDEINDYIDKIEFIYESSKIKDFNFLKNQDLLEIDDMYDTLNKNKIEILSTIDELNQYLNGYVTKNSLKTTLKELINKI